MQSSHRGRDGTRWLKAPSFCLKGNIANGGEESDRRGQGVPTCRTGRALSCGLPPLAPGRPVRSFPTWRTEAACGRSLCPVDRPARGVCWCRVWDSAPGAILPPWSCFRGHHRGCAGTMASCSCPARRLGCLSCPVWCPRGAVMPAREDSITESLEFE